MCIEPSWLSIATSRAEAEAEAEAENRKAGRREGLNLGIESSTFESRSSSLQQDANLIETVAQARQEALTLVTVDKELAKYGVAVIAG